MRRTCYDIETTAVAFTVCFKDYDTQVKYKFVCWKQSNELSALLDYWRDITHLISFNGEHFDNPVVQWIADNELFLCSLPGNIAASYIYEKAQLFIQQSETDEIRQRISQYRRELHCVSIDLFLYWAKKLRMSKKLSLKFFAHNLGMSIVEMPLDHWSVIDTQANIDLLLSYNEQDVAVTYQLATVMKAQINLRGWIKKNYKLSCWSKDAPKIAQELILQFYCADGTHSLRDIRRRKYIKPNPLFFQNILPAVTFKTSFFQTVYQHAKQAVNSFNNNYLYRNPDGTYLELSYGNGGIHTLNRPSHYHSTSKQTIWTIDVGSMYPTLIENNRYVSPDLGDKLLPIYSKLKVERFAAKQAGKSEAEKNEFLKLVLNSYTGLCDSSTCWLYAPEQMLAMRLLGQFILSRMLEELGLIGINVISLNTDGLEFSVPVGQEDIVKATIQVIETEFGVDFGIDSYQHIYYKTVNDYLAQTTAGKIKHKGEFICNQILDGANEFLVVPKAIEAYLLRGIDPETFIQNHTNVFDFCSAQKVNKDFTVLYRGEKIQRLNRYLVATRNKGAYLYKQKTGSKPSHMLKGTPVWLVNEACDKPAMDYPIDYSFYVRKARETIELFESKQYTFFGNWQQAA